MILLVNFVSNPWPDILFNRNHFYLDDDELILPIGPNRSLSILFSQYFTNIIHYNILSHYNLKYSLSLTPCLVSFANQFNIIENSNILSTQKCQVPRQSNSSSGESVVRVSFNKHKRNASWEEPSCQVDAVYNNHTTPRSASLSPNLSPTKSRSKQLEALDNLVSIYTTLILSLFLPSFPDHYVRNPS